MDREQTNKKKTPPVASVHPEGQKIVTEYGRTKVTFTAQSIEAVIQER